MYLGGKKNSKTFRNPEVTVPTKQMTLELRQSVEQPGELAIAPGLEDINLMKFSNKYLDLRNRAE